MSRTSFRSAGTVHVSSGGDSSGFATYRPSGNCGEDRECATAGSLFAPTIIEACSELPLTWDYETVTLVVAKRHRAFQLGLVYRGSDAREVLLLPISLHSDSHSF